MDIWKRPLADLPYLKSSLEFVKFILDEGAVNTKTARMIFFSEVLQGYYSPMFEGLRLEAGHVVYRLSDLLSEEERKAMPIYFSQDGSITEGDGEDRVVLDSLEDWRKLWENHHPVIPEFSFERKLEARELFALPVET